MSRTGRRTRLAASWVAIVLAATPLSWAVPSPADAQTVTGRVVDAESGAGLQGAAVRQMLADDTFRSTLAGNGGRFQLQLTGEPPFRIHVSRLGSEASEVLLDTISADPLLVELDPAPLEVDGVDVEVERQEVRITDGAWTFTEEGRYWTGASNSWWVDICQYPVVDSVVIRHPQMMREVNQAAGEASQRRSQLFGRTNVAGRRGPAVIHQELRNEGIRDSRLRREAAPCGIAVTDRDAQAGWDAPNVELPDNPRAELSEARRLPLSGTLHGVAVGPGGTLAVWHGTGVLEHLDLSGARAARWTVDVEPWEAQRMQLGWRADTLWLADPSRGRRLLFTGSDNDPVVTPARRVDAGSDGPPPVLGPGSLTMPIPAAGDRWLWTRPTYPPPYPRPRPEDPHGYEFVALTPERAVERVLVSLWPGTFRVRVDVGEPDPVLLGEAPFRDHPLLAVAPSGAHLTVVERGHPEAVWYNTFRVRRVSIDGDTLFDVERPAPYERIQRATVEAVVAELAGRPDFREAVPVPGLEEHFVAASLYRPPFHPAVTDVVVGTDGSTWLRGPDDRQGTVRWEVLDPRGELAMVLHLDRDIRIRAADDSHVWAEVPDGSGDRALVRYRIEQR